MAVISGGLIIEGAQRRNANPAAESVGDAAGFGMTIYRAQYSFAADGGAVSSINLLTTSAIPANFVILGGFVDVTTIVTSGGAGALAIQVEGANDIVASAVVSGAPWSTTGRKSIIPVFTGASSVKTSVARNVVAVISAAALTAGVVDVYLFGVVVA